MTGGDPLGEYAVLLEIRMGAYGRSGRIMATLFLLSLAAFVVQIALTASGDGRSILIQAIVIGALGAGWLLTWLRHEIARGQAELLAMIQRR